MNEGWKLFAKIEAIHLDDGQMVKSRSMNGQGLKIARYDKRAT